MGSLTEIAVGNQIHLRALVLAGLQVVASATALNAIGFLRLWSLSL